MKISIGADERHAVVDHVLKKLKKEGHQVTFYGPSEKGSVPWPEVARLVAGDVASGEAAEGILFCWTGTGVSIAANKVKGIRAALCADAETARGARLWNDANVLCLSVRLTTLALADEILKSWFETRYRPNPEDDGCLEEIRAMEG
jgi:ribose 5-phosphate isomerase B